MCNMTHFYVRHDSFLCSTWLISMCDMTHFYVQHDVTHNESCHTYDLFLCETWLIHWHVCISFCRLVFLFVAQSHSWLIPIRDAFSYLWLSYVRHDSSLCDMTHSHVRHDSFMSHIGRRHVSQMNESCHIGMSHEQHDEAEEIYEHAIEWVMSHIGRSHVSQMSESCHVGMSHEQQDEATDANMPAMSHVTHLRMCHEWKWYTNENLSRMRMSNTHRWECVTNENASRMRMSHEQEYLATKTTHTCRWMSHVARIRKCDNNKNESRMRTCHEWEWVMNHFTNMRMRHKFGILSRMRMSHEREYWTTADMHASASWRVMSQMRECVTTARMRH